MKKEITILIFGCLVLSLSYIYPNLDNFLNILKYFGIFLLVISINILTKKIVAKNLDIDIETKLWAVYYFGFKEKDHFKKPLPMIWLPLVLSIFSNGILQWFPILEFEEKARIERIARRHELYRFTYVTEWHSGLIAFWGFLSSIFLFFLSSLIGFQELAKISLFYSIWSLIPVSSLDGTKILFGSRKLWILSFIISLVALLIFSFSF
ncbi:MAG: hypothetical protein QW103_02515, partial [Candidatus Pacearchaeota archaeon]